MSYWRASAGGRYHFTRGCSQATLPVTLEDIETQNFLPCARCVRKKEGETKVGKKKKKKTGAESSQRQQRRQQRKQQHVTPSQSSSQRMGCTCSSGLKKLGHASFCPKFCREEYVQRLSEQLPECWRTWADGDGKPLKGDDLKRLKEDYEGFVIAGYDKYHDNIWIAAEFMPAEPSKSRAAALNGNPILIPDGDSSRNMKISEQRLEFLRRRWNESQSRRWQLLQRQREGPPAQQQRGVKPVNKLRAWNETTKATAVGGSSSTGTGTLKKLACPLDLDRVWVKLPEEPFGFELLRILGYLQRVADDATTPEMRSAFIAKYADLSDEFYRTDNVIASFKLTDLSDIPIKQCWERATRRSALIHVDVHVPHALEADWQQFEATGMASADVDSATQKALLAKRFVFWTSINRAYEHGYLGLEWMKEGKGDIVPVVCVQPDQFEAYVLAWGSTHIVIRLPADHQGIGYARRFLLSSLIRNRLPYALVSDDSIHYWFQWKKNDGGIRQQHVSLARMTQIAWEAFDAARYPALMGVGERTRGADVRSLFKCRYATSCVIANIDLLLEHDLCYDDRMFLKEDIVLSAQCVLKGLPVCVFLGVAQHKSQQNSSLLPSPTSTATASRLENAIAVTHKPKIRRVQLGKPFASSDQWCVFKGGIVALQSKSGILFQRGSPGLPSYKVILGKREGNLVFIEDNFADADVQQKFFWCKVGRAKFAVKRVDLVKCTSHRLFDLKTEPISAIRFAKEQFVIAYKDKSILIHDFNGDSVDIPVRSKRLPLAKKLAVRNMFLFVGRSNGIVSRYDLRQLLSGKSLAESGMRSNQLLGRATRPKIVGLYAPLASRGIWYHHSDKIQGAVAEWEGKAQRRRSTFHLNLASGPTPSIGTAALSPPAFVEDDVVKVWDPRKNLQIELRDVNAAGEGLFRATQYTFRDQGKGSIARLVDTSEKLMVASLRSKPGTAYPLSVLDADLSDDGNDGDDDDDDYDDDYDDYDRRDAFCEGDEHPLAEIGSSCAGSSSSSARFLSVDGVSLGGSRLTLGDDIDFKQLQLVAKLKSNIQGSVPTEHLKALAARLASMQETEALANFDFVPELGDGNCFYRAVAHQLLGNSEHWRLIKRAGMAYAYLHADDENFKNCLPEGESMTAYLKEHKPDGKFATEPLIDAVGFAIGCELHIFSVLGPHDTQG
jgi:TET-Associated Glycosyltransferase/OTU-like cysteine protease